jgi:hypothetical protein
MVVHGNVMAAGFIGSMREIFRGFLSRGRGTGRIVGCLRGNLRRNWLDSPETP